MILLDTNVRLTGLYFPRSLLFPFLKLEVIFSVFQSVETSPDCHDFSNSGLATSLASSLRTQGCISSGLMYFCTFR